MKLKNNKGVTGVDVTVAIVVMLVFVSLIASLFSNLAITSKKIERKAVATDLAINVLEAMKATNFSALEPAQDEAEEPRVVTQSDIQTLTGRNISIPNGYTVKIKIVNYLEGDFIKTITSEVTYKDKKNNETVTLETLVKNI